MFASSFLCRFPLVILFDLDSAGGTIQRPIGARQEPGPTPDTVFAGRIPDDLCLQDRIQGKDRMFQPPADKMIGTHLHTGCPILSVRPQTFVIPGIVVAAFLSDQRPDLLFLPARKRVGTTVEIKCECRYMKNITHKKPLSKEKAGQKIWPAVCAPRL